MIEYSQEWQCIKSHLLHVSTRMSSERHSLCGIFRAFLILTMDIDPVYPYRRLGLHGIDSCPSPFQAIPTANSCTYCSYQFSSNITILFMFMALVQQKRVHFHTSFHLPFSSYHWSLKADPSLREYDTFLLLMSSPKTSPFYCDI